MRAALVYQGPIAANKTFGGLAIGDMFRHANPKDPLRPAIYIKVMSYWKNEPVAVSLGSGSVADFHRNEIVVPVIATVTFNDEKE